MNDGCQKKSLTLHVIYLVARYPKHGPRGLISRPRRNASYRVRTPLEPRVGEANGSWDRRMFPRPPDGCAAGREVLGTSTDHWWWWGGAVMIAETDD